MYGNLSPFSLNKVQEIYNFTRCVRPNGTAYGTSGKCRKGTEQAAQEGKIRIGKRIRELPAKDLQKLLSDPRLKPHQVKTIQSLIDSKGQKSKSAAERMAAAADKIDQKPNKPSPKKQEATTAAAKTARPVDPKVSPTQSKEAKKTKPTSEEKAEQKWLAQKAKVEGIKAEHDKLIEELGKKGVKVYATGKGADTLNRMLKERGLPTQTQLTRLQTKLREQEPERLKQERLAKQRADNAAEIAGTSKEKRKEMILKELERLKGSSYVRTLKDVDNNVDMMQKWIREDPSMDTLKNRVALTAMRALRAEMARSMRQERRTKLGSLESSLRESPKYDKTPGSTKPADPKKLLGDYGKFLKKEKELDARRKEIENSGRLTDPKVQREYHNLLEEITMHSKGRIPGSPINLNKIYEIQGFNAKPELVQRRSDLESRKDILREPDGRPLILYRGVTEERFARQFQGAGPDGDKHYPGQGVYGNGTYAASVGANVRNSRAVSADNLEETAQRTARSYATGGEDAANRVTAFALRSDANIVQFEETKETPRYAAYSKWSRDILDQAEAKYGVRFNDHGEAAAAMGIHAYRVPMSDSEDYWVILNRGAVIASQDPELPN